MPTTSDAAASAAAASPLVDWSPHPSIHPSCAHRAWRGRLVDGAGREWVDYLSGWGSNILGYGYPRVTAAIRDQLELGTGAGLASAVGAEVEALLERLVPCAEAVAFGKNGSDATLAAVRLARAVTGRERVLVHGYHGFHDWYLAVDPGCPGVPRALRGTVERLGWSDLAEVARQLADGDPVAAVVFDPASGHWPDAERLQRLVDLAHQHGAVVVFDEIGTGCRVAPGGAQELLGVTPDLACFSKAIANGLPLSALVGRAELLERLPATRFGMTFQCEALSLAAARATLLELSEQGVCAELWRRGRQLQHELERLATAADVRIELVGAAPRLQLLVPDQGGLDGRALRWLFLQELARAGVHCAGIFLLCYSHDQADLELTVDAAERAFAVLRRALDRSSADDLLAPALAAALVAGASPRPQPPPAARTLLGRVATWVGRAGPEPLAATVQPLPQGFDWRAYLDRYPDLRAAGIDGEAKAVAHWREHGARERRWGTAASYPPRTALMCPSVHSLFLRPWGDVACWDDVGSDVVLQRLDPTVDYGRDVYLGPAFNRVRTALYRNRLPFPAACRRCLCLRAGVRHDSTPLDRRVMELLEVEPTYLCTLDCPGCVRRAARRQAPRPWSLPPATLRKLLADLVASDISVRALSFQGHGEPLLHPELAALVRLAKQHYPSAYLALATNGHGRFRPELLAAGVDELICAIDGVDQASYQPYRIGGDFATALRFLRDAAAERARSGRRVRVVWRYHVFAHNDAPHQLLEAQRLAAEAGVDQLLFVLTTNGNRSLRVEREAHIPRRGGALAVTCERHEPDPVDLGRRLVMARALVADGDREAAEELLASVAENLLRAAPSAAELGPAHQLVHEDLLTTVRELAPLASPTTTSAVQLLAGARPRV